MKSRIDSQFTTHDRSRITQGDVLRDLVHAVVKFDGTIYAVDLPYSIVITQDCDLEQASDTLSYLPNSQPVWSQFVPNVMLLPCFPADQLREGQHLLDAFGVLQQRLNSERWKLVAQNSNPRYHFVKGDQDIQVPDLAIDFKLTFSVPSRVISESYSSSYLVTLNELFRENLSQRYCAYLSRIGLPEIEPPEDRMVTT